MVQTFDLASLNGSNGFKLDSGRNITSAGDINGDGFDDIVTHGPSPASYIIFGKNSPFDASVDFAALDGNNGFQLVEDEPGNGLVTTAGDFDGDGFDDLLIAGHSYYQAGHIFWGKDSGFNATESLLDSLESNDATKILGGGGNHGDEISVSSAGDINGDGLDDIIFGHPEKYYNGIGYVVFGNSENDATNLWQPTFNGIDGFKMYGVNPDTFGASLSGAGDINGDGYDDLIVGANYLGNNSNQWRLSLCGVWKGFRIQPKFARN